GTLLIDIDSGEVTNGVLLDILAFQAPPNGGVLNTIGPLGLDVTNRVGFDIGSDNVGFAAVQLKDDNFSTLFRIDLISGQARAIVGRGNKPGRIGNDELVVGLALQLSQ